MDFKARVLELVSIYTQSSSKFEEGIRSEHSNIIIKGLLDSMTVANSDKNVILFDRINSVLKQIAKFSE